MDKATDLGKGGSTAVTAILINGQKLVVANVGDSRAVICKRGVAKQLSIDHEPDRERKVIEGRGGFVSNFPGAGAIICSFIEGNHYQMVSSFMRQ